MRVPVSPPAAASWLAPLALVTACLDPLVSDVVERPDLLLPAGTEVPDFTDSEAGRAQVARHDGLDGDHIELRSAFAGGEQVWYWDFGEASTAPIPLYALVQADDEGAFETERGRYSMLPNTTVFDAIPGDPGYSPWWVVVIWPVTDRYRGEVLASFEAFDEALRQGLIEPSITLPLAVNCPVVLPEARLQVAPDGSAPDLTPSPAFYRGTRVLYFSFDAIEMASTRIGTAPQYVLRREGGEPLSEVIRGVDMTRDGDLLDSNDLFAAPVGHEDYTGMVEVVDVVVRDGDYIDRTSSDAESALMSADDLFSDGDPDPERTVALYPSGLVLNRPLKHPGVTP